LEALPRQKPWKGGEGAKKKSERGEDEDVFCKEFVKF
jgi:hypothetical protein